MQLSQVANTHVALPYLIITCVSIAIAKFGAIKRYCSIGAAMFQAIVLVTLPHCQCFSAAVISICHCYTHPLSVCLSCCCLCLSLSHCLCVSAAVVYVCHCPIVCVSQLLLFMSVIVPLSVCLGCCCVGPSGVELPTSPYTSKDKGGLVNLPNRVGFKYVFVFEYQHFVYLN